MPIQFALATIHALQDLVVDLFADKRTEREIVIDPHMGHSDAGPWTDDTDVARVFPEASGSAQAYVIPLGLCEGDRVVSLEMKLWQDSGLAFTAQGYSVNSSGARTARGAAMTTTAVGWNTKTASPNYTLAVDETFVIVVTSAVSADKVGGGLAKVDHP